MTSDYKYLLPQPDPETQPFWDAAREHRLTIQRCAQCRTFRWPPTAYLRQLPKRGP